jgi:trafficking protein particle complex subunit 10
VILADCSNFQNNDVDAYKTTVKKQIRDWHSVVTTRKHQEWLILHLIKPDAQVPSTKFFQKNTVFEKIRADFNTEKRERWARFRLYLTCLIIMAGVH